MKSPLTAHEHSDCSCRNCLTKNLSRLQISPPIKLKLLWKYAAGHLEGPAAAAAGHSTSSQIYECPQGIVSRLSHNPHSRKCRCVEGVAFYLWLFIYFFWYVLARWHESWHPFPTQRSQSISTGLLWKEHAARRSLIESNVLYLRIKWFGKEFLARFHIVSLDGPRLSFCPRIIKQLL